MGSGLFSGLPFNSVTPFIDDAETNESAKTVSVAEIAHPMAGAMKVIPSGRILTLRCFL